MSCSPARSWASTSLRRVAGSMRSSPLSIAALDAFAVTRQPEEPVPLAHDVGFGSVLRATTVARRARRRRGTPHSRRSMRPRSPAGTGHRGRHMHATGARRPFGDEGRWRCGSRRRCRPTAGRGERRTGRRSPGRSRPHRPPAASAARTFFRALSSVPVSVRTSWPRARQARASASTWTSSSACPMCGSPLTYGIAVVR